VLFRSLEWLFQIQNFNKEIIISDEDVTKQTELGNMAEEMLSVLYDDIYQYIAITVDLYFLENL
jgi:hypothetical protein